MQITELRKRTAAALVEFAWDEWAQLGVFAAARRSDGWSQDPEALLVFTLHVARHDPRLFDEVLDWLRLNGDQLSGRRLSRLCLHDDERALVGAATEWAARHGSPLRLGRAPDATGDPQPLFPGLRTPTRTDDVFRRHGFLKAPTQPTLRSARPDPALPINLAFRLRLLFGVGARAEAIRFLLTSGLPRASTQAIADAAVSVKRNVNEALLDLVASGQVSRHVAGNVAWYAIDRRRWADFLGVQELDIPAHRDWRRILRALVEVDRFLGDPRNEQLDDYLRASEARRLFERLEGPLAHAGIMLERTGAGEAYWHTFVAGVEQLLATLAS